MPGQPRKKLLVWSILGFVLLLPASVFLFLEFFGDNTFTIPVFYQDEVPDLSGCSVTAPYQVTGMEKVDAIYASLPEVTMVLHIQTIPDLDVIYQLNRLPAIHGEKKILQLFTLTVDSISNEVLKSRDSTTLFWREGRRSATYLELVMRCGLLLPADTIEMVMHDPEKFQPAVLLDRKKRIRGYYNVQDREEVDRLLMEIAILDEE